jgi:hypothetical protein
MFMSDLKTVFRRHERKSGAPYSIEETEHCFGESLGNF